MLTAQLVDSARPGDTLFPLDRGFEKLRITTSLSDSARFKHKVAVAKERLQELLTFELDDIEKLNLSLNELEIAIIDIRSEIPNVDELTDAQDSAVQVTNNLLELIARYRAFLQGETTDTDQIQQELDDSVEQINTIVSTVVQNNPTAPVSTLQPASPKPSSPAETDEDNDENDDDCEVTYAILGSEIEQEGVILQTNSCGDYTARFNGKTYVLISNNDLGYAVGKQVKFHGQTGTNNSIFITEFELDN
jgi:hypothetical protein